MMTGRIVIIPFLQGKLAPDGTLVEPDIDAILEKWLNATRNSGAGSSISSRPGAMKPASSE